MKHVRHLQNLALRCVGIVAACALVTCHGSEQHPDTEPQQHVHAHAAGAHFGYAVAMSGDYAVVGQPDDLAQGPNSGAAYIYKRQDNEWVESAKLVPEGHAAADFFGISVAIDNHTAIVGASGANQNRGAAYVFERVDQVWVHVHSFMAASASPGDAFGLSVAISGNYAFVGAPGHDVAGQQAGAVFVFQRQQGHWQVQAVQELLPQDAEPDSRFGASIALSNTFAVIGAPKHDAGGLSNDDYGAAYHFTLKQGLWLETAKLQASDRGKRDYFGRAVAITDRDILVGAPNHDDSGAVYVFMYQENDWHTRAQLRHPAPTMSHDAQFGAALALSGDMLLIGAYAYDAPHSDNMPQERAGAAYLFWRQSGTWVLGDTYPRQDIQRPSYFGYALALFEDAAIVGAPSLSGLGTGRIYTYSNLHPQIVPTILSLPITRATVGNLYVYTLETTSAGSHAWQYTLRRAPAGMRIDPTSGVVTWMPDAPGAFGVEIDIHNAQEVVATQAYILTVAARPATTSPDNQNPEGSNPNQAPNQASQITSSPPTQFDFVPPIPIVAVTDSYDTQYTVWLNGQPYTPGVPITRPGIYQLTVQATDAAGNSSTMTIHFTIESKPLP